MAQFGEKPGPEDPPFQRMQRQGDTDHGLGTLAAGRASSDRPTLFHGLQEVPLPFEKEVAAPHAFIATDLVATAIASPDALVLTEIIYF